MNTIRKTDEFLYWIDGLADPIARANAIRRIQRAESGNFGDHHYLEDGISEMRIDHGPGYRLYYAQDGATVYLLLAGGDKRAQSRDIGRAKAIWKAYREGQK